jgi:hypothetical protein
LIGDARPFSRFATQPYGSHGSFSLMGSPTRATVIYYYRLDAAEAEMVHRKIWETSGPISAIPGTKFADGL